MAHSHEFALIDPKSERRTLLVVVLTGATMLIEIAAGLYSGSMALLADGWHMGTHVAALLISYLAYGYARRHSRSERFSFGTGKVGVLAGFASAVGLAVIALLMGGESIMRLFAPASIRLNEAIAVAFVGLSVNIASAFILQHREDDHHDEHSHPHHHHHHHDHNLRAAYLHVLADALTSLLAIIALLSAKYFGYLWLDPVMGIVGGLLIASWSYRLIRDTSAILLDRSATQSILQAIRAEIEADGEDSVNDLHIWQLAPGQYGSILSVTSTRPKSLLKYREILSHHLPISHATIEISDVTEGAQLE